MLEIPACGSQHKLAHTPIFASSHRGVGRGGDLHQEARDLNGIEHAQAGSMHGNKMKPAASDPAAVPC